MAQKKPHILHASGNYEWYTPKEYIEAARNVLGHIDLDPASSAAANSIVQADRFYCIEHDGLTKHWAGRVWLNPPYAAGVLACFAKKLRYHVLRGDITAAIVLVNNATETKWFNLLAEVSTAMVFPKKRISFITPDGSPKNSPLQGQAFLYTGRDTERFLRHFLPFGWGMCRTAYATEAAKQSV